MQPITLIGYGRWGKNIARNLAELGVLSGICESSPKQQEAASAAHPDVPVHASIEHVPGDHAVAIAAPAAEHARLARFFLERGQHVFVEKPLALQLSDGEALRDLAHARGLVLMVGHLLHYHPAVLALQSLLDDGVLGRLRYLYSNRLNLGRFRREENSLWSFAPHDIALLLRFVGSMPRRVIASGGYFLHPRVADTTMTVLDWDSGVQAHVYVSWLHPFKEQRLVVVGEDGMVVFDDRADNKLLLYRHGVSWRDGVPEPVRAEPEPVPVAGEEPLRAEMNTFLQAIDDPSMPLPSDADEGLRVLRVLDAAERSLAHNGTPVSLAAAAAPDATIHPSAVIGRQARIGLGSRVWHFCHVMDGAIIGAECVLGQNCFVQSGAVIGDRVRLQNNISVYRGVVLEDDVFCGPSCVFTNVVRPRAHVSRREEFASTRVGRGATIGANATVVCGNDVGAYAFVAAGAVVTRDMPAHALAVGQPARVVGWVCRCGERLAMDATPELGATATCHRCAASWGVGDSGLVERHLEPVE